MPDIHELLWKLDKRVIAERVDNVHYEYRNTFKLNSNIIEDREDYETILADYYNHHYMGWLTGGRETLNREKAVEKAEIILMDICDQKGITKRSVLRDICEGTNRGISGMLDMIANHIKAEHYRIYIHSCFNEQLGGSDEWQRNLIELIRQFLDLCKSQFGDTLDILEPSCYTKNYQQLILAYTRSTDEAYTLLSSYTS